MGCAASSTANLAPITDDVKMYDVPNSPPPSAPMQYEISFKDNLTTYGKYKFKGTIANKYLQKQGLPAGLLDGVAWQGPEEWSLSWTKDEAQADKVAKALIEWARDHGANARARIARPLPTHSHRQPPRGRRSRAGCARRVGLWALRHDGLRCDRCLVGWCVRAQRPRW